MVVKVVAAGVAVVFVLWTPSNSWLGIHHRVLVVSVVVEFLLWLFHRLVVSVVVVRPSSNGGQHCAKVLESVSYPHMVVVVTGIS